MKHKEVEFHMKKLTKRVMAFIMAMSMICVLVMSDTNLVQAETVYVDRKADVVFVIDATGSMGSYITSVKENLTNFISQINGDDIDVRVKFVIYRDITCDEDTTNSSWYTDADAAINYLQAVKASGGGDGPETMLDGVGQLFSSEFGFRSDAIKFCITLTDADTKIDNTMGYTCEEELAQKLVDQAINSSVITHTSYFDIYENFVSKDGGVLADISGDYSVVLKDLADSIVEGVKNMVVHEIYPTTGIVKKANKVTVKATGLNFDKNFKVTLGGKSVGNLKQTDTGFEFTTPTTLALGSYDICVINGTGATNKSIGKYTYVSSESDIGYKVLKINPATGQKGQKVLVKVTVDKLTYKDDFSVTVGGETADVQEKESGYFTFYVPTTLEVGTYDIVATNGTDKKIGKYIVTERTTPVLPDVTSLSPNTTVEGTAVQVSAKTSAKMTYGDDFAITVGGEEAALGYKGKTEFRFTPSVSLKAGTYDVELTNNGEKKVIGSFIVTAKEPEPVPRVIELTPDSTEEGKTVQVSAKTDIKMTYRDDYAITVGGKSATLGYKGKTEFRFTPPVDLSAGVYDIELTNNGVTTAIGTFTVIAKEPEPLPNITLTNTTVEEGKTVQVSAKTDIKMTYGTDYAITVGGETATLGYKGNTEFRFTPSATLAVGTHDIVMTNKGVTTTIGTFTVTAKEPEPLPNITLSITTAEEGTTVQISAKPDIKMTYGADYAITVGGEAATLGYKGKTEFRFTPSATLPVGTHDVVLTNNGETRTIGSFTVTAKKPEPLPNITLTNTTVVEGKTVQVSAKPDTKMTYGTDYAITVGGEAATLGYKGKTEFRFTPSATLPVGTHDIVLTNNGVTRTIGSFIVTAKPPVTLPNMTLSYTTTKVGTTVQVSVKTDAAMTYGSDYAITVGGQPATLGYKGKKEFRFTPSATLPVGTHDIVITDNGVTKTIGTFTVTAK